MRDRSAEAYEILKSYDLDLTHELIQPPPDHIDLQALVDDVVEAGTNLAAGLREAAERNGNADDDKRGGLKDHCR